MNRLRAITRRLKSVDPLTAVCLTALVGYAVIGIGSPLLGLKVFAATDLLAGSSPYRDTGLDPTPRNTYLNDTIDSYLPGIWLYVTTWGLWNPYIIGGTTLGATPNLGLFNPIAWPYFLLPIWLAPGYVKLAEIAVAAGGTFLFCRRIGLARPAALLGGLGFASSGFMVAWTNWPHTRVAAFLPVLFWALERLVQHISHPPALRARPPWRRISDGVLVSLVTAALLFGGFPAVAGYGLLFGGLYLVVRGCAEYPGQWRRLLGLGLGSLGAVLAGVLLTAVQLLPFVSQMSAAHVEGRGQTPDDHLLPETLVTALAPWAMGTTDPSRPPSWYVHVSLVESLVYVGAGILVLAVLAVALPRAGRSVAVRGVWWYLVVATGALLLVLYAGGPPLALLQQLPVLFADNFVGRARSVLGLLVAVLAAVGFHLLLTTPGSAARSAARSGDQGELSRRAGVSRRNPLITVAGGAVGAAGWVRRWYGGMVWVGVAVLGGLLWVKARRTAYAASARDGVAPEERVSQLDRHMLLGIGLALLAAALVALVWWLRGPAVPPSAPRAELAAPARRARLAAAALLPVLIAGQALSLAVPYWPRSDRETFYPVTDTHRYLAAHLGHDRFAGSARAMYVGADSSRRLRALTGHFFLNRRFAEVVDGLPGRQFGDPPTYVNFPPAASVATSPVLDRLGVRYFVVSPGVRPLGEERAAASDETVVTLRPGRTVPVPVPAGEAGEGDGQPDLRGIGLTPVAGFPTDPGTRIDARLVDSSGRTVARSRRTLYDLAVGRAFWIPFAETRVPDGGLTARLTLRADHPMRIAGLAGRGGLGGTAAVSTVTAGDDGLRLAYAGSTVIYQRLHALPRIRWASRARVEPDPRRRVALLASGRLAPGEVLLDAAPAGPSGAPGTGSGGPRGGGAGRSAELDVTRDGTDRIEVRVSAAAAGHLVIADALQQDWVATVDGAPAELLPADHGLVAVRVPKGDHTVRLAYRLPYHNLGGWLTGATAFLLVALVALERWRVTVRQASPGRSDPVTR